jgi:tetratricopeptide (TPR) repeat protein
MAVQPPVDSPWRSVFEEVRARIGNRRDADGVLGSINWLRKQMARRGANPNVVRNIIYRNRGRLADKTALWEIFKTLWRSYGFEPLRAPELERLLRVSSYDAPETIQLLGRDKRQVYSRFVTGVAQGDSPKLLISGRPGSGKTLLLDYIQQALEQRGAPLVRLEGNQDLANTLTRFAAALGMPSDLIEGKLLKVTASSAYAVQADAQADVARSIIRHCHGLPHTVIILHVSQALSDQHTLGASPLRLNTPDVSRVSASEWLYVSLLAPLSQLGHLSLLVSMARLPVQVSETPGRFEAPIRLSPPTLADARRYIKGRLPHASEAQQEALAQQAGRSFEELRTLTLLAELREELRGAVPAEHTLEALSQLISSASTTRLRDFLAALAVVSLPEFPTFEVAALSHLRPAEHQQLSALEQAFLDPLPAHPERYRGFSRQFVRRIQQRLSLQDPALYRQRHQLAASYYQAQALRDPTSEAGGRYPYHLFEARDWRGLAAWLAQANVPHALLRQIWQAAQGELTDRAEVESLAYPIAARYVQLGGYHHPEALRAFDCLEGSDDPDIRLWTLLKRAEGALMRGHADQAERYLEGAAPCRSNARLNAELELIRAGIARWRSRLDEAASRVNARVRPQLAHIATEDAAGRLIHARVAVWAGLIAKDGGDLQQALSELSSVRPEDELLAARLAFQQGDVQLKLGRFDAALAALNAAVAAAQRSEALIQEQIRYRSRRAMLHTLRGELRLAEADFDAALAALTQVDPEVPTLERDFWRAKVADEHALYLLATAAHDEAIALLQQSRQVFQRYQAVMGVDASYRLLRNTLRLISAYAFRGWGRPFDRAQFGVMPFAAQGGSDLQHARARLQAVLPQILSSTQPTMDALKQQALRVASLVLDAPERRKAAQTLCSMARYPYQQAEALTFLATTELDAGVHASATEALLRKAQSALKQTQSKTESGDRALAVWLQMLQLRRLLHHDVEQATTQLITLLREPSLAPYQALLKRCYAEALDQELGDAVRAHPALRRLGVASLDDADIRLSEALLFGWEVADPELSEA